MIIERMDRHHHHHQNSTSSTTSSSKSKKAPPGYNHKELSEDMKRLVKLPMERRMAMAKERRKEQLQWYNVKDREPKVKVNDCKRTGSSRRGDSEKRVQFESSAVLFSLICEGDVEGVRNLISSNNRIKNVTNHHGMTALHQSCIGHNLGMIHALVKEFSVDISIPDQELWTPLHTAALLGFTDVAKFLLDNGADPLALNADRNMAYDICDGAEDTLDIIELRMVNKGVTQEKIEELRSSKELEMLKELESAFDSDNSLMQKGDNGETLLHVAASLGYKHVAKFLLTKTSITIDDEDNDGWQAIHCAAYWNQLNVVELLVDHGACIYSTTPEDETALDLCRDETMKEWMTQKAEQDNKHVKKASCVRRDTRKASIQEHFGTSHFDSLVSLNELNKFSHSSNRLNAEMKEAKKKKDLKLEYQSLVTSPADDPAYDHSAPPTPSSSPPTPTILLSSSPPTPTIIPSSAPPSWTLNPVSSPISKSAPESSPFYLNEKREITRSHSNLNSKSSSTNCLSTRSNSSYVSIYNNKLENYGKLDSPIIRDDPFKQIQRSPSGSCTPSPKSPNLAQTSGKQFVFPAPRENGNIVHRNDSKKQGHKERSNSKKEKSEKIPKSIQKLFHATKESSRATRTSSLIPTSDPKTCEVPRRINSNLDVSRFVQIYPGDECDATGHKNKTQNSSKKLKTHKKRSSKCVIS